MKIKYYLLIISILLIPLLATTAYAFSSPNLNLSTPISYNGPLGSKNNPYLINSINDYNNLMNLYQNDTSVYLKLNFDLTETSSDPINRYNFNGNFDGNNHTISFINSPLFTSIGGTVSNLIFKTESLQNFEAICGILCNTLNGTIINCTNNSNLTITSETITSFGCFAGENSTNATISNCTNNSNLNITVPLGLRVGGFLGQTNSTLTLINNVNNGNITVNSTNSTSSAVSIYAGGFIGYASYKTSTAIDETYHLEKLKNAGEIKVSAVSTATYCRLGGILGGATNNTITSISQCSSHGSLTATNGTSNANYGNQIGGLVGYIHGTTSNFAKINISNSYSTCTINSTLTSNGATHIGGLIGFAYSKGSIDNCVTVNISNSYSSSSITSTETKSSQTIYIGGLIGQSALTSISNSFSKATINALSSSTKNLGGIIGSYYNNSTSSNYPILNNVISNTNLSYKPSTGNNIGGFIGYINVTPTNIETNISNSTFLSSTLSTNYTSSYCTQAIGNVSNVLTNTGSNEENQAIYNNSSSFYLSWDFNAIWNFSELPTLKD